MLKPCLRAGSLKLYSHFNLGASHFFFETIGDARAPHEQTTSNESNQLYQAEENFSDTHGKPAVVQEDKQKHSDDKIRKKIQIMIRWG